MSEENEKFTPAAGDAVLVNHEGKPAGARVEAVEQSGKVDARITDYGHPKHGMVVKFAPEDVAPLPADYVPPEPPKPKPSVSPMTNTGRGANSVKAQRVEDIAEAAKTPNKISYWKENDGWWVWMPGVGAASVRKHGATENADGTLTLNPSLLMTGGKFHRHGYLQNGCWNPCGDDQVPDFQLDADAEDPGSVDDDDDETENGKATSTDPPAPDSEEFKEAVLDLHAKLPKYAEDVKNFVKVYVDEKTTELEKRIAVLEDAAKADEPSLAERNGVEVDPNQTT